MTLNKGAAFTLLLVLYYKTFHFPQQPESLLHTYGAVA
jgi:hypothetical protein